MKFKMITAIVIILVSLSIGLLYVKGIFQPKPEKKTNLVFMMSSWAYGVKWVVDNKLVEFPENVKIMIVPPERWNELFITGDADMGMVALPAFVSAWQVNKDWKILSPHGRTYNRIVTRKDSNITSLEDLKGKRIGIGGLKLMTTLLLLDILEKHNISQNSVTLISKPFPVIPFMVQKGEIDAGILTIDQIPLIENLKLKVVVDLDEEYSKLFGTYAVPAVIAAKKTLNKSTIRKTLECIEKALELSYEYRLNISNSFLKEYGTNMTDLRVYKEGNFKIFTPWDENKKSIIKYELSLIKKFGLSPEVPELEEVMMEI